MFTKQASNKYIKRMLTTDFANEATKGKNRVVVDKMNDSQSTFLANNPSFKQQLDCFSNLVIDKQETGGSIKKGQNVHSSIDMKKQPTMNGTMVTATDPRGTIVSTMSKQM